MKSLEVKKAPKVTVILNITAIVMGLFAIFNIYTSYMYISSLTLKGFDPSSQVAEVINYYLSSVTPYVFYGITLAALGYIIKKIVYLVDTKNVIEINFPLLNFFL